LFVAQLCGIPEEIKHKNTLQRYLKMTLARTSLHSNVVTEIHKILNARPGPLNQMKSCSAQWFSDRKLQIVTPHFACDIKTLPTNLPPHCLDQARAVRSA
jgi:hypothetical protein